MGEMTRMLGIGLSRHEGFHVWLPGNRKFT
jgi:hypothetical protein